MLISNPQQEDFGIYVHWPFCAAKCPYCDFNSHVRRAGIDEPRFVKAYLKELDYMHNLAPNRKVSSVFFGGGTPSLMSGQAVAAIIDKIDGLWGYKPDVEISLEANPTSIDSQNFAAYKLAGVNRISIGVQAMNDVDLRKLGRMHTIEEAKAAIKLAQGIFERISFDLIYARPQQTLAQWQDELKQAIELGTDHLSLYQLTIESGTRFADLYKMGKINMPDDDHARKLYDATEEICAQYGLYNYEISNYAKAGEECRHNLIYWRYEEYAAIGAGAHSRLKSDNQNLRYARMDHRQPEKWLELVEAQGHAFADVETLSQSAQATEYLLMCLRLREGVSLERYKYLAGVALSAQNIADMVEAELLVHDEKLARITTTEEGLRLTDYIIGKLLS
ncbi:MAG: coproporphyrinogen III oxidase [Rhizobiales bacterium]|nr:radical SAM family heme chaperone HemW [Hyphomicrobiales bacterium]NRB15273.1 coproporphyrinogen III oxidase [Hyphomicrobiales bacterium]